MKYNTQGGKDVGCTVPFDQLEEGMVLQYTNRNLEGKSNTLEIHSHFGSGVMIKELGTNKDFRDTIYPYHKDNWTKEDWKIVEETPEAALFCTKCGKGFRKYRDIPEGDSGKMCGCGGQKFESPPKDGDSQSTVEGVPYHGP